MTTTQTAETRYSIYTPDGENWGVWDAHEQHFVDNPHITDHHRMLDFDSQRQAEQVRDELNAAAETPAETESDDSDDEPGAPVMLALPKPQDHQRKQPRSRSGKPGTPIQRAIAAYRNRAVLTVDAFMKSLGADSDTIRRYRGSLGRKVAQAWRAATGSEPVRSGWAVAHHRLIPVYAYQREDAEILRQTARSYQHTANLIGA